MPTFRFPDDFKQHKQYVELLKRALVAVKPDTQKKFLYFKKYPFGPKELPLVLVDYDLNCPTVLAKAGHKPTDEGTVSLTQQGELNFEPKKGNLKRIRIKKYFGTMGSGIKPVFVPPGETDEEEEGTSQVQKAPELVQSDTTNMPSAMAKKLEFETKQFELRSIAKQMQDLKPTVDKLSQTAKNKSDIQMHWKATLTAVSTRDLDTAKAAIAKLQNALSLTTTSSPQTPPPTSSTVPPSPQPTLSIPTPYPKRAGLAIKAAPMLKADSEIKETAATLRKLVTVKDVTAIETATGAGDSSLGAVTQKMKDLARGLTKVERGELTGTELNQLSLALHTAATDYVKSHKNPLTKDGKARLAAAQQMLQTAEQAQRLSSAVSDKVLVLAQQVEKSKDDDLGAMAVNSLEALLSQPLLLDSVRDKAKQVVAAARKRLAALHAGRLSSANTDAEKANVLLDAGGTRPPSAKGQSDSFFIKGTDGKPAYLLKPTNGESRFSDAWPDGGGAAREVFLSRFNDTCSQDLGLDFHVPKTSVVTLEDDAFTMGTLSKDRKRTGALQTAVQINPGDPPDVSHFLENGGDVKTRALSINEEDAQAVAVLDFITLNGDRHAENLLVQNPGDQPGQTRLVPIDAGQAFPTRDAFKRGAASMTSKQGWNDEKPDVDEGDNLIMQLPVAQRKFDGKALQAIKQLDPDGAAQKMRAERDKLAKECPEMDGKISDESIEISRRSQMLLQAAASELSIREISNLYASGFVDIIDAPDPAKAIAEAVQLMKTYRLLGGDMMLQSKRVEPMNPPLSLREKVVLAQKVKNMNFDDAAYEQNSALVARLAKLGQGFVSDSCAEDKKALTDLTSTPLPKPISGAIGNVILDYISWESMGGDAHVKRLLAGNDPVCAKELQKTVRNKAGRTHGEWVLFFKLGGYPRLKQLLGPAEYKKVESDPFETHAKLLEEKAAQAG